METSDYVESKCHKFPIEISFNNALLERWGLREQFERDYTQMNTLPILCPELVNILTFEMRTEDH